MAVSPQAVVIEDCSLSHLTHIRDIYNHYVQNTAVTFEMNIQTLADLQGTYGKVKEQGLPYIVAIDANREPAGQDTVLGYAYATQFRQRPAYAASVEISVYCDPSVTGKGYGKVLLNALIQRLREVPKTMRRPHGIQQLLAVCVIVPDKDVRGFYEKAGFVPVGHLSKVGWKFEKWWDTCYSQLSLTA